MHCDLTHGEFAHKQSKFERYYMGKPTIVERNGGKTVSTTGIKPGMIMVFDADHRTIRLFAPKSREDHRLYSHLARLVSEEKEEVLRNRIEVIELAFNKDGDDNSDNQRYAGFLTPNTFGSFVGILAQFCGLRACQCLIGPTAYGEQYLFYNPS